MGEQGRGTVDHMCARVSSAAAAAAAAAPCVDGAMTMTWLLSGLHRNYHNVKFKLNIMRTTCTNSRPIARQCRRFSRRFTCFVATRHRYQLHCSPGPDSIHAASQESQASGLYSIISLNPLVACARSRIQLGMISGEWTATGWWWSVWTVLALLANKPKALHCSLLALKMIKNFPRSFCPLQNEPSNACEIDIVIIISVAIKWIPPSVVKLSFCGPPPVGW